MTTKLHSENMNVEITMLPVTAGDATLIVWSDGGITRSILIDAGLREHDAVAYLQLIGIFHLDLIILSHPDLDHLGGLLAIMKSRAMSVDRIWCFDLAFLREFIRTGRIPQAQQATREVVYEYALMSTLDQFSDILKTANRKGVQVLQVSEGYKLCLGGVLLEVLYPPQSFYDALHSPIAIKRMLNRKLPEDWRRDREEGEQSRARELSGGGEEERLTEIFESPRMPEEGVHLSDFPEESEDERPENAEPNNNKREQESEQLPWKMVGTLYNNLSIVVKATFLGGINSPSVLFPGDLSDWTTLVLRQWTNLKSEILKVPHHGSKNVTCNLRSAIDAMDFPFPWRWFFEEGYPYLYPFPGLVSRAQWQNLFHAAYKRNSLEVIRDIVRPSHLLVFPHPQHRLPSARLGQLHSNLIANRVKRDLSSLSNRDNEPLPARIHVGLEQYDVKEI